MALHCNEVTIKRFANGQTVSKPCTLQFPHRHVRGGKPTTEQFVTAPPPVSVAAPVENVADTAEKEQD